MTPPNRQSVAGQVYLDLRRLAQTTGRATDELLQLYALEGFLDRLTRSDQRQPVELERWEQAVRARFVFLTELDADEQHWARCDPRDAFAVQSALTTFQTLDAEHPYEAHAAPLIKLSKPPDRRQTRAENAFRVHRTDGGKAPPKGAETLKLPSNMATPNALRAKLTRHCWDLRPRTRSLRVHLAALDERVQASYRVGHDRPDVDDIRGCDSTISDV